MISSPDFRLPAAPGLSFKPEHFAQAVQAKTALFFEVHAENYMGAGGAPHAMLERLHAEHALSIHGVGLSIGGAGPLDPDHLKRLRGLLDRHQPESFSEHLAWSSHGADWLNDLLPLPYTDETLTTICAHIDQAQTALGRRLLLENPATYVTFADSTWPEADFLREIAHRTGCGLLLDVNNVFVSATNHRTDPRAYLAAFPLELVGEIHLAGHEAEALPDGPLLIDSHSRPVADPVWTLYAEVLARTGPLPSLVEWDNDVPGFDTLLAEAARAETLLTEARHAHAA
ncbi:DUF692 domain-containing protein [Pararhodobacter zhoushanensis]|uniref:MNIO family bufferin maturase n=1 Tax=Pararhodobacter zhoushanensis TaxID=2479545 RepID=UPI000F8F5484|nr:DUF692 domain-containing protein [Pararhodobacter zhoushanensis]